MISQTNNGGSRGALAKFELGGPCMMQKNQTFSVMPPFALVIFAYTPPPVLCEDCCPSPQTKLQMGPFDMYKYLGSFTLFRLG